MFGDLAEIAGHPRGSHASCTYFFFLVYYYCTRLTLYIQSKKALAVEAKHQISGATVIAVMTRVGDSVWIGSERQILVVQPAAAYKVEASWRAHERVITDLLSSGQAVWSCSQDSTIRLWDVKARNLCFYFYF